MAEHQSHNIVAIGAFIPVMFHPVWFSREKLIPESEAESAKVAIIHPDLALFSTDWLEVQVLKDQFVVNTKKEAFFEPVRDFAIGTFRLLGQIPVTALGFNYDFHLTLPGKKLEKWLDSFFPIDFWSKRDLPAQLVEHRVKIPKTAGKVYQRYILVQTKWSNLLDNGLHISLNYHFQLSAPGELPHGCSRLVELISAEWEDAQKETLAVYNKIIGS